MCQLVSLPLWSTLLIPLVVALFSYVRGFVDALDHEKRKDR